MPPRVGISNHGYDSIADRMLFFECCIRRMTFSAVTIEYPTVFLDSASPKYILCQAFVNRLPIRKHLHAHAYAEIPVIGFAKFHNLKQCADDGLVARL